MINYYHALRVISVFLIYLFGYKVQAQTAVSFSSSKLSGITLNNPTSLQFGPDNRLYVTQQNGFILACTIRKAGTDNYQVTASETISEIRNIPNHNDDGSLNTSVKDRQITGILVTGTATNPVLYVSSSDPRIGGGGTGGDKNLDTNSGVVSKLSWNGSIWIRQDVVLGLPRSEENHSVNGMQLDEANQILYLAVGGHTNAGAPSNNFAFLTEYALSAAILSIDLTRIQNEFGGKYNLPTLDDPTRSNSGVGGSDVNDPFGGNDGLNQAKLVEGGPVQIHSAGYRNSYDLVLTRAPGKENRLYTIDNGANGGWGGHPDKEGITGTPPITYVTNNYVAGEPGSTGPGPNDAKVNNLDNLHLVSKPGMKPIYGGHPTPIRANPTGAGLYRYDNVSGTALFELKPTSDWPPVPASMANPVEGDFRNPGVNDGALYTWTESTNGMAEYTSDAFFGGSLTGDLLTASYDGIIYRIKLSEDGTSVLKVEPLASGFGSIPLDVTAPVRGSAFEGTVWSANYGSDDITVFEPSISWQMVTSIDGSLPQQRHECGFIEVDGKLYLIGGRETTLVDCFDPVTNKWTTAGQMPFKMHHFQPVSFQGKVYVVGAFQGNYAAGNLNNSESPVPFIYVYDPLKKTWTQGPSIPRPRGAAGLIVHNNEMYLMGGIVNGHHDGWVKWMDKYNPSTGEWIQLPDMPRERDHFQAVVLNGKIYVAGGRKTNALGNVFGPTIGEVDVFNLTTKSWSTLPAQASLPTQRAGAMNVVWNDQLFIAGGESTAQKAAHNQVQSFDPKSNTWRTHPNLVFGRHGTGMLVQNGKLFTVAGSTLQGSSGVTSSMEKLEMTSSCQSSPNDYSVDADGDGFSNGDETLNGNNYCSPASRPADADGDFLSDLLDTDDDNDGISDSTDLFVLDPANGMQNFLPAFYPFLNGDPGTGFFGLGFTGLMSNGKTDYLQLFDSADPELIMGGAVGIANTPAVSGDAGTNTQKYAFHYGFRLQDEDYITIRSVIQGPFFGGATGDQLTTQSHGIFIGTGDQDNYLKCVLYANNGKAGFRIYGENSSNMFTDQILPVPEILSSTSITLIIGVDRVLSKAFFSYQLAGQSSAIKIGESSLPVSFGGLMNGSSALAVGLIASSGTANRFSAAWDYLQISGGGKPELKLNIPEQYTRIASATPSSFNLDLNTVVDGNGDPLTFQVISIAQNSFITGSSISGSMLSIDLAPGKTGSAVVTVRAANPDGAYIDYSFLLKITSPPATVKLINAGGSSYGNWSGDVNFSGGKLYSSTIPIANTTDDIIYQTERYGSTVTYNVPVPSSGHYQVRLHFAEIYHGVKNKLGIGARLMDVSAEGRLVLDNFDIFKTAGGSARAIAMTIDSVHVSDNTLELKFLAVKDQAKISGIQISAYATDDIPNRAPVVVNPGKIFFFEGTDVHIRVSASDLDSDDVLTFSASGLPPSLLLDPATGVITGTIESEPGVFPVNITVSDGRGGVGTTQFEMEVIDPLSYALRINSGGPSQTLGNQIWRSDQFFIGGTTYSKALAISETDQDPLFQTDRYGKFSYQIPVPGNARYKVKLLFAEKYFNAAGLRVFNILFESGAFKRSGLDVFGVAGSSFNAYQENYFVDVKDGLLDIQFESIVNNAMVSGIELTACAQPVIRSVTTTAAEICQGQSVTLSISGDLNSADQWVLYSGSCGGTLLARSTTGSFEIIPEFSATYYIRAEGPCVVSTACISTDIKVNELPTISSIEASSTQLCETESVTLTVKGKLGSGSYWKLFADSCNGTLLATSTTGLFEVKPEATTTYYLTSVSGCSTAPMCASVVVNKTDLRPVIHQDAGKLYTNIAEGTFEWIDCTTNQIIPGENQPFYRPQQSGTYRLKITQSSCMAESECEEMIVAEAKNDFDMPVVSPNPAEDILTIACPNSWGPMVVRLVDWSGRPVLRSAAKPGERLTLDVSRLSSGFYVVHISSATQNRFIKIIKQ